MKLSRRHWIAGAGAGVALIAAGGWYRVGRTPQSAALPWQAALAPHPDPRIEAFRYAILAPNPHNRQPWLIKTEGDEGAGIFCDLDKRLPETDPFDRQTVIGFGAFLELARIAATQNGIRLDVDLFPDGKSATRLDKRPVARLRFVRDAQVAPDPLARAIVARRSNKEPYDIDRTIGPDIAARIAGNDAEWTGDAARIAALRSIILNAVKIEQHTPAKHKESVDLIRIGAAEVDANPDGIDISGAMAEAAQVAGILNRDALADPGSSVFRDGEKMLGDSYGSIPALLWVMTETNSRADQIEAGRRYVRANLRATILGLAMHPMSQSLQEYTEMTKPFADVHRLLGHGTQSRVQMLARFGYGPKVGPAPRWPLARHMV